MFRRKFCRNKKELQTSDTSESFMEAHMGVPEGFSVFSCFIFSGKFFTWLVPIFGVETRIVLAKFSPDFGKFLIKEG